MLANVDNNAVFLMKLINDTGNTCLGAFTHKMRNFTQNMWTAWHN